MNFGPGHGARVTPDDIAAATDLVERTRTTDYLINLLFQVPDMGPGRTLFDRDQAAVGTVLISNTPGGCDDDVRRLAVIRAMGRTYREDPRSTIMPIGVVMLGGEIAARYLYQRLIRQHGPYGLEPLATAISILWPPPGEEPPRHPGHPGMSLARLVSGPMNHLFTPGDIRALRALAGAFCEDQEMQLRCTARICNSAAGRPQDLRSGDLPTVRESVLTSRTATHLSPPPALLTPGT
ncbi:hypothetical protein [Streptomyces sp. NBC_00691]|uniref:hypothetical protein n=1 Tax=Streptomyces sp. NBC_00691 TaxID=2903671 RepID=UPI002E366915|nr:hypothetical protein [Streptomyces sp. NBC_00691]